jgi:hypothetical protein
LEYRFEGSVEIVALVDFPISNGMPCAGSYAATKMLILRPPSLSVKLPQLSSPGKEQSFPVWWKITAVKILSGGNLLVGREFSRLI